MQSAGVKRVKERQEQLNSATWTKVAVAWRADLGPLEERTPALFEPAQESAWPAELELSE